MKRRGSRSGGPLTAPDPLSRYPGRSDGGVVPRASVRERGRPSPPDRPSLRLFAPERALKPFEGINMAPPGALDHPTGVPLPVSRLSLPAAQTTSLNEPGTCLASRNPTMCTDQRSPASDARRSPSRRARGPPRGSCCGLPCVADRGRRRTLAPSPSSSRNCLCGGLRRCGRSEASRAGARQADIPRRKVGSKTSSPFRPMRPGRLSVSLSVFWP